jgi:formamidopyrimidine-DNA glycosylase
MPELPEVETLKRALVPLVKGKTLLDLKFFRKDLRFPIPQKKLRKELLNKLVSDITRRGKYLLLHFESGAMLIHLGMSGRMTQHSSMEPVEKHTHAVFRFEPSTFLHFIDTRRFGCILWAPEWEKHPLIINLGLEPLADSTTSEILYEKSRNCKASIKSFLMDAKRLTGVGNIYACESLFKASINPKRPAGKLTKADWKRLLSAVKRTLEKSIASGGTTLQDFFSADGTPGYFAIKLVVYGKEGQPCPKCGSSISRMAQTGRSTFYCKACQKK